MDNRYDVLIVGGGPAGLSAAYSAAKAGVRVALFEKSNEIGYPIHTSGGSWIDELRALDIPDKFMHPIHAGYFYSPNQTAIFEYETPVSCILEIRGLYQYLAEQASAAGVQIYVSSTAVSIEIANEEVNLAVRRFGKQQTVRAPLIIDASGATSFVGRKLGLVSGFQRYGLGAEYDLYAPDWPQDRVAFFFGSKLAPCGYAWAFPHPQNRLRVGVGIIRPDTTADPKILLEEVLTEPRFRQMLGNFSRLEFHSGIIPSESFFPKTAFDRVLLVGDAGGLISTLLGEGIRFAIDIGRMAGQTSALAIQKNRYDQNLLSKYDTEWQKKYKRTFQIGALINKRLSMYSDKQWDAKIKILSRLNPELLPGMLKGDFGLRMFLRLIQKNPELLSVTMKSRLKSLLKSA